MNFALKTLCTTGSYRIDVPQDTAEDVEDDVVSLWRKQQSVLLKISSHRRHMGTQMSAESRLKARLEKEKFIQSLDVNLPTFDVPDFAASGGIDNDRVNWIHCYWVWADLALYITISWSAPDSIEVTGQWAIAALKSLRRNYQPTTESPN